MALELKVETLTGATLKITPTSAVLRHYGNPYDTEKTILESRAKEILAKLAPTKLSYFGTINDTDRIFMKADNYSDSMFFTWRHGIMICTYPKQKQQRSR